MWGCDLAFPLISLIVTFYFLYFWRVFRHGSLTCVFIWISDRPSCQFCPHSSDLHHGRPSVRRVSQSDSEPLDVRTTVHLHQVRAHDKQFYKTPALGKPSHKRWGTDRCWFYCLYCISFNLLFCIFSSLFSNEQQFDPKMKLFTDRLLHRPGLGTRCMEGEPLGWVSGLSGQG